MLDMVLAGAIGIERVDRVRFGHRQLERLAVGRAAGRGIDELFDAVFAGLFAMAAVYVVFNEGFENWQAMWTGAVYVLLGSALWRARTAAIA